MFKIFIGHSWTFNIKDVHHITFKSFNILWALIGWTRMGDVQKDSHKRGVLQSQNPWLHLTSGETKIGSGNMQTSAYP